MCLQKSHSFNHLLLTCVGSKKHAPLMVLVTCTGKLALSPQISLPIQMIQKTHEAMPSASAASDMPENDGQSYLRNMCLFYLKLQGQLLIPASTIQTIVEEMQDVHDLGQAYTIIKVSSLLKNDLSLSDEAVTKICDCIKESDLFSASHQGQLRTTYTRNQTFTKMFKYTEPQKVALGMDKNMTQKCAYYIPVAEILKSFLQSHLRRNTVKTVWRS